MTDEQNRIDPDDAPGARTASDGTPIAVDVSGEGKARAAIALFVAGPVIWSVHFMVLYLVVEAGCSTRGPGFDIFNPPVPTITTYVGTAIAVLASIVVAVMNYRRWRARRDDADVAVEAADPGGSLAFAGFMLALLGIAVILFVGLPALALPAC